MSAARNRSGFFPVDVGAILLTSAAFCVKAAEGASHSKLSPGAITGIVLGSIAGVLLCACCCYRACRTTNDNDNDRYNNMEKGGASSRRGSSSLGMALCCACDSGGDC